MSEPCSDSEEPCLDEPCLCSFVCKKLRLVQKRSFCKQEPCSDELCSDSDLHKRSLCLQKTKFFAHTAICNQTKQPLPSSCNLCSLREHTLFRCKGVHKQVCVCTNPVQVQELRSSKQATWTLFRCKQEQTARASKLNFFVSLVCQVNIFLPMLSKRFICQQHWFLLVFTWTLFKLNPLGLFNHWPCLHLNIWTSEQGSSEHPNRVRTKWVFAKQKQGSSPKVVLLLTKAKGVHLNRVHLNLNGVQTNARFRQTDKRTNGQTDKRTNG